MILNQEERWLEELSYQLQLSDEITASGGAGKDRVTSRNPITNASLRVYGLPPESWRLPLCGPRLDGRDLFVLDGWQQAGRTVSAP